MLQNEKNTNKLVLIEAKSKFLTKIVKPFQLTLMITLIPFIFSSYAFFCSDTLIGNLVSYKRLFANTSFITIVLKDNDTFFIQVKVNC